MKPSRRYFIKAGARSSPLSRAQVAEIEPQLPFALELTWVETTGDLDQKTSLRTLGQTDFFTRELDQLLLDGSIRLAIHSAKDLPDPLPEELCLVATTKGLDPRDSLVYRHLPIGGLVATSSKRREEMVRLMRPDLRFTDLRGTIHQRLEKLNGDLDGVVIAEAALIRLNLTHLNRMYLPGFTATGQGKLAIVCRKDDVELREILSHIEFVT